MITEVTTLDIMINKAKENLSEETKAAINAVNWKLILSGINKKYNADQLENLETETELLLCGLVSTEDYPKELESRMHLHKTDVVSLINEIDKLVFKKIQEELESRLNGGNDKNGKIVYTNKPFVIDPRFISLPKEVQEAISYSGWKEKMYDIAKKFKLNIEQTGLLEEITTKVILNTIHTDQYENEIRSKIDLGDDKIKEMVAELNENVFKNIKKIMENASTSTNEEKKIPTPPYVVKKEDVVPLPPVSFSSPAKGAGGSEKPAQKEIEDILSKMPSPSMGNLIVENTKKVDSNIITDKLFGNTTSKTTVSDYSLPKINNQTPERSHDPYHEQI